MERQSATGPFFLGATLSVADTHIAPFLDRWQASSGRRWSRVTDAKRSRESDVALDCVGAIEETPLGTVCAVRAAGQATLRFEREFSCKRHRFAPWVRSCRCRDGPCV